MNATTKFYAAFFLALAIVVAVSYYAGMRAGMASATHGVRASRAQP